MNQTTIDNTSNNAGFNEHNKFAQACRFFFQLRGFKRQAYTALLGGLTALALAPIYLIPLCFITFPALIFILDGLKQQNQSHKSKRHFLWTAFLTGWSFGFGYFVAGLWWLANAMTVDLAQFGWAIPLTVFGLPAFLACYYGIATFLALTIWPKGLSRIILLSLTFTLGEYLRGVLFTGFPWNAIGYTAMPSPLFMQTDYLIGINGMNAFAVFIYSLPALIWQSSPFYSKLGLKIGFALGLILLTASLSFDYWRLELATQTNDNSKTLHIRLVQPNIAQTEKQDASEQERIFNKLLALTSAQPKSGKQRPDLIIWPETAVPYLLEYNPQALRRIAAHLKPGQELLTGAIRVEKRPQPVQQDQAQTEQEYLQSRYRFYNAMLLINDKGEVIAHSDKVHLVPFGEYLPLKDLLQKFHLNSIARAANAGPYSAGQKHNTIALTHNISALPLICYEAIFPRESVQETSNKTDIIINITNDAWFGNSPGPRQHLEQARLRAVEQNRPLIRVANNGISAYIDSLGRIKASIPYNHEGFLDINPKLK